MPAYPGEEAKAQPEKSYLSSAVDSINPWSSSRTATPTPANAGGDVPPPAEVAALADHTIKPLYGQSFRNYPKDCPPLKVQWFHAVDVPKRKPKLIKQSKQPAKKDSKPPARPKKFTPFSESDSRRVEARYQKLLEAAEDGSESAATGNTCVAVNEDYLFDVDIQERELSPVYWLGPVYEVRRGTWFFQESSGLRPCEENLAAQLEEGYLKTKPWLHPASKGAKSKDGPDVEKPANADAPADTSKQPPSVSNPAAQSQPEAYRLFGAYMNNVATFQDDRTAWMTTEGMLSWVATSVYERFSGGGFMSGVKLIRGYTELSKAKEKVDKPADAAAVLGSEERQQRMLKRRSAPPTTRDSVDSTNDGAAAEAESRQQTLKRQLSSFIEGDETPAEAEERIRKRDEQEIRDDYNALDGEVQGREIEHLILVTHGIGQRLGLRMESVNFVHDVNVLRKTTKSVYSNSADLKALNSELGAGPGNCRVQLLPVCWRHLFDFPRQPQKKTERDLGDAAAAEDDYPSLEDITVEGVAFARSLISDLALDVLLYQSSYREEISRVVVAETNRILTLFRERNPEFRGKVHLMGHSLGSAIYFDVLCRQREKQPFEETRQPLRFWPSQKLPEVKPKDEELEFDFEADSFFCLGSPIGLFQMLKGRTIAARSAPASQPSQSPLHGDHLDDPFLSVSSGAGTDGVSPITGMPLTVSSPKASQLFNIFHPSDPISYRMEPLISSAMASLKPQALPYTKKGIFGVAPQGLTDIGAKVGQSVSGMWSSLSAGIASNLLNRSLGLSNEEVARLAADEAAKSPGAERIGSQDAAELSDERKRELATARRLSESGNNLTLIDDELETLYSSFQKRHDTVPEEGEKEENAAQLRDDSRKARRLRVEEAKVRALNRNGRVDYSIQESALDFNPMNTIASHVSYWADEDVNHFVLSQLLSGKPKAKQDKT